VGAIHELPLHRLIPQSSQALQLELFAHSLGQLNSERGFSGEFKAVEVACGGVPEGTPHKGHRRLTQKSPKSRVPPIYQKRGIFRPG
jgi:hypothetical protein